MYFLHMSKNLTKLLLVLIIISRDMFEQFCREYRYYSINYRRFRRSQHYEPEIDFVSACQLSYQIKNKALSNTNSEMMMLKWFLVDKIESKFYLLNTVLYQAEFIDNHIKNNLFFALASDSVIFLWSGQLFDVTIKFVPVYTDWCEYIFPHHKQRITP